MPTDKERYFFDLYGYLVVRQALDAGQVKELNELVDHHGICTAERGTVRAQIPLLLEIDAAFREVMVNPRIMPYMKEWLGPGLRLDHAYFVFGEAGEHSPMHLGATPYVPPASYHVRNGRIFSGLTVASYALTPVAPGEGFACIPGSHKSEFPCPPDVADLSDRSFIVTPQVEPGDAVIFSEATTHGALPWTSPHQRRALLYKYSPGHMSWFHPRWPQSLVAACTDEQRAFLEPPYVADAPGYFVGAGIETMRHRPWNWLPEGNGDEA